MKKAAVVLAVAASAVVGILASDKPCVKSPVPTADCMRRTDGGFERTRKPFPAEEAEGSGCVKAVCE